MRTPRSLSPWLPVLLLTAATATAQVRFTAQPRAVTGPGSVVQLQATFPPGHKATLMQFLDCGWFQALTPWGGATRGVLQHTVRPASTTRYRLYVEAPDGTSLTHFLAVRVGQPRNAWEASRWADLETKPADQLAPAFHHNLRHCQYRPSIQKFDAVRQVRAPEEERGEKGMFERGMTDQGTPSEGSAELGRQPRPGEPLRIAPGQQSGAPTTPMGPTTPGMQTLGEQVKLTIDATGANLIRVYGGTDLLWESPDLTASNRTFNRTVTITTLTVHRDLVLWAANAAGVQRVSRATRTLRADGSDPGPGRIPEIK